MNFSILKSKVSLTLMTLALSVFLVGNIFAQSGTATITGIVTDSNAAAVPGATVTITNPQTGFTRSVTSDSNGGFTFPSIPTSTYTITVENAGFKKSVVSNVRALIDSTVQINVSLEIGDASATVDVTTNSIESVINNQDATLGNNFVPEQITQLPTELRRANGLLSLQPGVTEGGYVSGGRSDQANVTLDGVDVNDQQSNAAFGSVLRLTTEAVEEFRITTSNANANQGRSSGAQISLNTKSGTNNIRGAAFYFYRPTQFSANDFFNNKSGVERPSLARDIYGGAIGGPIKKDKLFFFYSYEGQFQKEDAIVSRLVPLSHIGNEIRFSGTGPSCSATPTTNTVTNTDYNCAASLAEFSNTIFADAGSNPIAVAALVNAANKYRANEKGDGDGINTGGFRFNSPTTVKENTHIARIDYNLSDTQQIFARGNYQFDTTAGTSRFPDTPSSSLWSHPNGFVLGHTWTISDNKINSFRYGYTRQTFSQQGDSSGNAISFRDVFSPLNYSRTLSRVTPVQNITDDFTYIKGNHSVQFGGNLRIIRNKRDSFASAYDSAVTNASFYQNSGSSLNDAFVAAGYGVSDTNVTQSTSAALIGRFSQYAGNFTFALDGSVEGAGTPSSRNFATEEVDFYIQDRWKPFRNLTITAGVRYALSRPVYEQNGFQVVPTERLGDFFDRRVESSANGVPLNDTIEFERAGPANDGQGFYSMDYNNIQPRIAVAWSPNFENGFLKAIFGEEGESTLRGGFAKTNDFFGGQLAVSFDGLSTIGFTSQSGIAANTYGTTIGNLGPLFTGFNQDVRALPGIPAPVQRFSTPADEAARIESSLDGTIVSPEHYTWNASFGRSLPKGAYFEASYVGRRARNLFAARDIMALNNLTDPASGMDWYTAAGMLVDANRAGVAQGDLAAIPYFENLFSGAATALSVFGITGSNTQAVYALFADNGGFGIRDYTFIQQIIDDATSQNLPNDPGIFPNMFFHPQYAAFSAFGTTAESDYHGASLSLRQRLGNSLSYDFNYTFSKSFDNASGLATGGSYGSQFILNSLRPDDNYSVSDFDTKHVVNANFIWKLPFGKGQMFDTQGTTADFFIGGWQLTGIGRMNSGLPLSTPFEASLWATNWNLSSNSVRTGVLPLESDGNNRDTQTIFTDPITAYNSLRNARPGETGDRNVIRLPRYWTVDMGLAKTFDMPWAETQKLQFRWEVFNVANRQAFQVTTLTRSTFGVDGDAGYYDPTDPTDTVPSADLGKIYNGIQGNPRRMQFGLRYTF